MTAFRFGALALACVSYSPLPARAADIVVNTEAACASIRGTSYDGGGSCRVERLVVPAGTRVVVPYGVGFYPNSLINDGVLETNGRFDPGPFTNRGTLITSGITVNWGFLVNKGTWLNRGWLHPHHAVINEWNFENVGLFETCSGQFVNRGFMHNRSYIDNWGGWIANDGLAVNDGSIYNPDASFYHITNSGALENNVTIENGSPHSPGTLENRCGGAIYGPGALLGGPVEDEPCRAADAVNVLVNVVFALQPAGVLAKDDALLISGLLQKAAKRLAEGNEAEGAALLTAFDVEVGRLVSDGLSAVIGRSLVARADRALALIANPEP